MGKQNLSSGFRFHFSEIDSTTLWANENINLLDQEKINLITADKQNRGRGKAGRVWISPEKVNIYGTFCFFLPKSEKNLANLTQTMSISICKALEELGFSPKIKWPNDISISGKKLAGILCQIKDLTDTKLVTIGVGLNVNMTDDQLKLVDQPATSLFVESGNKYDKDEILEVLQRKFIEDLAKYRKGGFSAILDDYNKRLIHHPQDQITITTPNQVWSGKFIAIDSDGKIEILTEAGVVKSFTSGDIIQ